MRLVLSDPRFYMHTGFSAHPMFWRDRISDDPQTYAIPEKRVATNFFCDTQLYDAVPKPANNRSFFVCRDPLDLLISWYFSNRYSHDPNPAILEFRRETAGMTDEEGIEFTAQQFHVIINDLLSWHARCEKDPAIPLVRFENLTGVNSFQTWQSLLKTLDLQVPDHALAKILSTYKKENLTPPKHSKTDKYGSVGRSIGRQITSTWKDNAALDEIRQVRAALGYR